MNRLLIVGLFILMMGEIMSFDNENYIKMVMFLILIVGQFLLRTHYCLL